MHTKVLIADDLGSINQGVYTLLSSKEIPHIAQAHYPDDAYLQIKKAYQDGNPFDLFITDLSFKEDHQKQRFTSGDALVAMLHKEHPDLKVIVYSVEDKLQRVRTLYNTYNVQAYVSKSRDGLKELDKAIELCNLSQRFISQNVALAIQPKQDIEINDYDIYLMSLLSQGLTQEQISNRFKAEDISPRSVSSIEKRLNKLRIKFKANNVIHLIAIGKDLGLI